jgi:hypothetical protein
VEKKKLLDKGTEMQNLPREVLERLLNTKGKLKVTSKVEKILNEIKKR